jgi:hypothetical protein
MVCIAFDGGPTARLDLPASGDELEPWLETLTQVYLHTHHPARVALVAFGEDGPRTLEALAALGDALSVGPVVGPILWVKGDEWTELLTATRGTVSPSARARIDAELVVRGRVMPLGSREELAASMQGDASGVAAYLPQTSVRFRGLDAPGLAAEAGWIGTRVEQFLRERSYLRDPDAARVLVALGDTRIRHSAALAMTRANSPVFSELWQDLTRRAPAEVRDRPATLLALSSWLEGHGAKSWSALDQLSEPNRLGNLVEAALRQSLDPRTWDTAVPAVTGALIQQAALGERRGRGHLNRNEPGINPDPPGPGLGR